MHAIVKLAATVVTVAATGYGAVRFYKFCKTAYEKEVHDLKYDIQNYIDNITALSKERNETLAAERSALLEEARAQLLKAEPDVETLRSLLLILKGTLNNMLQDRTSI